MPAWVDKGRLRALAPLLLAGLLPCAVVFFANTSFVLDHFYARAPYLLDSGWGSALVYRAGLDLVNPPIACEYAKTFYGVHVSPFLALFSVVSYVVPITRIDWYAVVQGIIYAPFGFAAYVVASRSEGSSVPAFVVTAVWSLAFAFSAQVLLCIDFPHFEPAIAALSCLLLASVVTERRKLVWPLLLLTVSVREDAGIHAGLALLPLLYLQWRGARVGATRRRLIALIVAAFGASVLDVLVQKTFFSAPSLFRTEYLGEPPLAHVTVAEIGSRLRWLLTNCPYLTVPLAASVLVSAIRRDARYLLGWLAAGPWFVVNLLAHQTEKCHFTAYAGFPFLVSFFWVYLYGCLVAPPERRIRRWRLEALLALASTASVVALWRVQPWITHSLASGIFRTEPQNPTLIRSLVRLMNERHDDFGRLSIDEPVAAYAIETMAHHDFYGRTKDPETFIFHRDNPVLDADLLLRLAAQRIGTCQQPQQTNLFFCTRSARAAHVLDGVITTERPAALAFTTFETSGRDITSTSRGVVIGKGSAAGLAAASRNLWMPLAGDYQVTWDLGVEDASTVDAPVATLEVLIDDHVIDSIDASSARERHHLVVPVTTTRNRQIFGWRLFFHGGASVVVERVELRTVAP